MQWPSTRNSLLLRIRNPADDEAWSTFVELYSPPIFRVCIRRGLQEAGGADVTQTVLMTVSISIRTFEYNPLRGQFRSWLGTVTHRLITRHSNRLSTGIPGHGGNAPPFHDPISPGSMAEWEADFNAHIFNCAVQRIRGEFSSEIWSAFEMVWLNDQPPKVVAETFDQPISWVYKVKFRVLRRLRVEVLFLASDFAFYLRN